MASIGARKNRFGGYALPFHKWQVDVWSLNRTWAHTDGHVQVKTFDNLKNATLFRCDEILYDVSKRKIDAQEGYFQDFQTRILKVKLLPNPNPKGNAVRVLQCAMLKDFFGDRSS